MSDARQERDARIIARRHEGATLERIGEETGLTRERVRQILKANDVALVTHATRMEDAIEAWRASGEVREAADVAKEHGLAPSSRNLAALRAAVPHLNAIPRKQYERTVQSRAAVVAMVRDVALANGIDPRTGWLSFTDYDRWRKPTDLSGATITSRYLWSEILDEAGFDRANSPTKRGRKPGRRFPQFTDEQLDEAVVAYLDSAEGRLTTRKFEDFLIQRPEFPSLATIRIRFARRGIRSISGIIEDVNARRRTLEA